MSNTHLGAESAHVTTLPSQYPPMPAVARLLASYDREKLSGFIEVALGLLDVIEGDPDAESEAVEDDFSDLNRVSDDKAAGCPIADAPEPDDFLEEDDHSGTDLDAGELCESEGAGLCGHCGVDQRLDCDC